jgi:uncharacterized protein (DUF1800 family)
MHSRREFVLRVGGLGIAGLSLGLPGCDRASESLAQLISPEDASPARPPANDFLDDTAHAINRLTWGARPGDRARIEGMGAAAFVAEQLNPSAIDDRNCQWRVDELETMGEDTPGEFYEYSPAHIAQDMSRARLIRALHSKRQLYELMVEVWTDHFNIGVSKGECKWMKLADDRWTIRPHAMGNFRALVKATLVSPAMLISLDGQDNRVVHPDDRPNENHARELLELHTLGVDGGYTQRDVMETARCLSGWTFTHDFNRLFTARVKFDPARHDQGSKEVLGVVIPGGHGEEDIERLLDLLCTHSSTARHVARRLCRTFIADPAPTEAVTLVADTFQQTNGDLRATLEALFACEQFRTSRGNLLKRPMHFVVSALRGTDAQTDCGPTLIDHLERMGHAPFQYSTPDGYPLESAPWLGTLLWRWTLAMDMIRGGVPGTRIDPARLRTQLGGDHALTAHLLGRQPTDDERQAIGAGDHAIALALASPAFQWH